MESRMKRKKLFTVKVYRCTQCGYTWNERKGRNVQKCRKCGGKMVLIDKYKTKKISRKSISSLRRRIKRGKAGKAEVGKTASF